VGSAFVEILFWGEAGKGAVGAMMIVEVLEAIEDGVEGLDSLWEIVGFVELVTPGAVAAFNGTVELGRFGWQASSNPAMNSEPPSTWMALGLTGMSRMSLSRNSAAEVAVARLKAWPTVHLAAGS
jgi:hypothetical protein